MTHFAKVVDGIVTRVIVAEPDFFTTSGFMDDSPGKWIQTYKDASQRVKHAGVGDKYDYELDAFIGPKPYPSWSLNSGHRWESPAGPIPEEEGKLFRWDEENQVWVKEDE